MAFLVYHKEHNLNIKRCNEVRRYFFEGKWHKYYPDFITDLGIIEIKGISITPKTIAKLEQNPDIILLDRNDMKEYLDYIYSKYGDRFWEILYEKPS